MKNQLTAIFLIAAANCAAAQLTPAAARSFDSYVADVEARLVRQHARPETYLASLNVDPSQRHDVERQLMSGEIRIEPVNDGTRQLDGALLHHWRGAAFVPRATAKDMLTLLQDFHDLAGHYPSGVVSSRAITKGGDTATLAVRFKRQVGITIVLDAEYRVESRLSGDGLGYSYSRSTHFWEVEDAGTAHERHRPEGDDDGFLWRLNSYWSFSQTRGGLEIECEAVSLTRDIPLGLGWLITPIVGDLPRELLSSTISDTKNALAAGTARRTN